MLIILPAVAIVSAIIGGFMAQAKNKNIFLWCFVCFLFPLIGLVILAFSAPSESEAARLAKAISSEAERTRPARAPVQQLSQPFDLRKWRTLVEVDPDIAQSVKQLAPYGQAYVNELAEKFLSVGDKSYLPMIVSKVEEKAKAALAQQSSLQERKNALLSEKATAMQAIFDEKERRRAERQRLKDE